VKSELSRGAAELARYMSELSEHAYSAAWMDELEFVLWRAVLHGPCDYGRLRITDEHIVELRKLSAAAGGWIVFDVVEEESLIAIDEWERRYRTWQSAET
jgi:hypothetical protein